VEGYACLTPLSTIFQEHRGGQTTDSMYFRNIVVVRQPTLCISGTSWWSSDNRLYVFQEHRGGQTTDSMYFKNIVVVRQPTLCISGTSWWSDNRLCISGTSWWSDNRLYVFQQHRGGQTTDSMYFSNIVVVRQPTLYFSNIVVVRQTTLHISGT
jgi:hypothetical protein